MGTPTALVVPSSVKFYTDLVPHLAARNPSLAQDVIRALNAIDRGRNRLYQSVMGPLHKGWNRI